MTYLVTWIHVFSDFNDLIFDISNSTTKETGTCTPFSKKMFITAEGKILQCERIAHHFALGQILDDVVQLNLDNVVHSQNELIAKLSSQCQKCHLRAECHQCIFNIDDICNDHPICPSFLNKHNYNQNKIVTINYLREHPQYYEKILKEVTVR